MITTEWKNVMEPVKTQTVGHPLTLALMSRNTTIQKPKSFFACL